MENEYGQGWETARKLRLVIGDITSLQVEAIVNAANSGLRDGGGICGAIHRAAGPGLRAECSGLGGCPVGQARSSGSHALQPKGIRRIIHAVGPIYNDGQSGEPDQLASCYRWSLETAAREGIKTIAFPCISTGIFGYPIREAAPIAIRAVVACLGSLPSIERVVFCCFTQNDFRIYTETLGQMFPNLTIPGWPDPPAR